MKEDLMAEAEKYPPSPPDRGHNKPRRLSRVSRATEHPHAVGAVNAAYLNAIEIAGLPSSAGVKGMGMFAGLCMLVGSGYVWEFGLMILEDGGKFTVAGLLFVLMGTVILGVAITFLRSDLFSYRDEPTLFNRKTRKVYAFRRRRQMKRPWARWPLVIDVYDWEQITGEIHGGFQLVGGSLPSTRYRLVAAVSDQPTTRGRKTKIIDEIILGMDETYQDDCVARWEHIRRYMEEDGPPLPAGERLALTRGFSHRLAFARGGLWVLIPGFYDDFRKEPIGIILGTLAQLITLPAMLMFAFFRWLAEVTSKAPWWPEAVLRDAGGAPLPEDQVHAEADALKRAQEKIREAALDDEERHERDMIKAKAGKPFWTTERKKFAIAIAAVIAVVAIGKGVQAWLSGT